MFILFPRDQHKKSASVKNKEVGNSHISVKPAVVLFKPLEKNDSYIALLATKTRTRR